MENSWIIDIVVSRVVEKEKELERYQDLKHVVAHVEVQGSHCSCGGALGIVMYKI